MVEFNYCWYEDCVQVVMMQFGVNFIKCVVQVVYIFQIFLECYCVYSCCDGYVVVCVFVVG